AAYGQRPLSEHWNGTSWSAVIGPTTTDGTPRSVSCSSATNCIAVGGAAVGAGFAQRWNGKQWFNINTTSSTVFAVACASATSCLAVGLEQAQRWNGTSWSEINEPKPAAYLFGVSCASTKLCFAVGSDRATNSERTLIERTT